MRVKEDECVCIRETCLCVMISLVDTLLACVYTSMQVCVCERILSDLLYKCDEVPVEVEGVRGQYGGPRSLLPSLPPHHGPILQAGGQK